MATLYNEQELVSSIMQNEKHAFDYLYKHYSRALFMVINKIIIDKHNSEDILQEAFVNIWNNIEQYDVNKGCFYTWMRNIAKNKAIDYTRCRVSNMRNRTDTNEDRLHLCNATAFQKTDHIGMKGRISALPSTLQQLICLVYYKGHTIEEISKLLNLPLGTIKSRMRRALSLLRADFMYLSLAA